MRRPGACGVVAPHSRPRGARTPQLLGLSGGGARGNRGYTYWEFGMHRTQTVTRMVASLGIDRGMGASFPVRAGPAHNGTGAGVYCQRPYCALPPAHAQTQVSLPTSFLSSGCPERPDGTRRPGLRPYFSLTSSVGVRILNLQGSSADERWAYTGKVHEVWRLDKPYDPVR